MSKPSEPDGGGEELGDDGGQEDCSGRRRKKAPSKLPACAHPVAIPPTFYNEGYCKGLLKRTLLALGWKRTLDKNNKYIKLRWVHNTNRIKDFDFIEGTQMLKVIPNCHVMTNKLGLLCSLREYERATIFSTGRPPSLQMADFVPETYKLDEPLDRTIFLNVYQDGEMWLCKPAGMDRGNGITLLRSRGEIDNLFGPCKTKWKNSRPRIIQRYIANPLLLDGRKFDIRNYMLIASTVPFLVLFHHGFARLSCLQYNSNDTSLTSHLTNQAVQKKIPNFADLREDSIWSMETLNEHINSKVAPDKNLEQNWVFNTLTKQMQRIMLHCFKSVKRKLERKIGYFDFYGFDFMIDDDMKVWLLESNLRPSMDVGCTVLKEIKQRFIEETVHLSIEAFEKSRKNQPLMPLKSLKNCVVLYCGTMASLKATTGESSSSSPAKRDSSPERARKARNPQAGSQHFCSPGRLPHIDVSTTQVSPYAAGGARPTRVSLPDISFHSNSKKISRQQLKYQDATACESTTSG